jgi:hypothetical protein
MKCDFCGHEHADKDILGFNQDYISRMASIGFVPSGFVAMVRKLNLAPGQDPAFYFRDVISKHGQSDIWALCSSCISEIQEAGRKHLSSLAKNIKIDEIVDVSPE